MYMKFSFDLQLFDCVWFEVDCIILVFYYNDVYIQFVHYAVIDYF